MPSDGFCEFKESVPHTRWVFNPSNRNRKLATPRYGAGQDGITKGPERAIVRCPACGKRLRLLAEYCIGGEFTNWIVPDHKPRKTRSKSAKRQTKTPKRGN